MSAPRGSSLVEVLMASMVLILGMVGVITLLVRGAVNQRLGQQAEMSGLVAGQLLSDTSAGGFLNLAAGAYDAGPFVDSSGRVYRRTFVVLDATADAGYPSFEVQVRVESSVPTSTTPFVTTAQAVVSRVPDAG